MTETTEATIHVVSEEQRSLLDDIVNAIWWQTLEAQANGPRAPLVVYQELTQRVMEQFFESHDPTTAADLSQYVIDCLDARLRLVLEDAQRAQTTH